MKIHYNCDSCGDFIDTIETMDIDEAKFGFDALTPEERQDLIRYDSLSNCLHVRSLCDSCIEALGLADEEPSPLSARPVH